MTLRLVALAVLLLLAVPAQAKEEGRALFAARGCVACHGAEGTRPLPATPILAGQNAAYLLRQMNEIADGTRHTPGAKPMRAVIDKVGAAEREVLARWLSHQSLAPAGAGDATLVEKGSELFDELGCIGCHGGDGAKPLADYPLLAGQRRDYLAAQIRAIRDEVRSTRRVRLMVANVRTLRDDQVEQIAEFLSHSKRNQGGPI